MLGDGKADVHARFQQDDMTAALAVDPPPGANERPYGIRAGDDGKLRHQRATSTSRVATVSGMPLAARASRQPSIASRMFRSASSSVFPCETHPGIAGHSATIMPVSS